MVPVTEADGRLGLCDFLAGSPAAGGPSWAELAYNSGARINRWEFRWDRLEAEPGTWDFSGPDAVVQSDMQHGLQTEGILIGTPGWAVRDGQKPGNGLPHGLRKPITDPGNVWADYVRQTVHRYAGQVRYWEIWNEPDLKFFWSSSPQDYYLLLKVSYQVIKTSDPSASVLLAGMVAPDFSFVTSVLDAASHDPDAPANHGFFDIAAWHAYGPARLLYSNLLRFNGALAGHGHPDVPIWVTEDGFPASNPNGEPRQAAYILQTIAYALAAGASRVLVYRSSDDQLPKTWGIMTATGSPRMAYNAFAVAARYLSGVRVLAYDPTAHFERFAFYTARDRITLTWNRDQVDRPQTISTGSGAAKLIDWQGGDAPLVETSGQYRFAVPGAAYNRGLDSANVVVGGPLLLLVEANQPPGNLGSPQYVAPVKGTQRRLVVLNDSPSSTTIQVAALSDPRERVVATLGPRSVQFVDLDLLAGAAYQGLYALASTAPVAARAVSDQTATGGITPAGRWYIPAAPPILTITNTSLSELHARAVVYGASGKVRATMQVDLGPREPVQWSLPASLQGRQVAVSLEAPGPLVVFGPSGALANAVAQPGNTWYAISPASRQLSIFNPSDHDSTHVDVRFVGSKTVKGEQLRLAEHHSYSFSLHRARAVVVSATTPVALGYAGSRAPGSGFATQPATHTALASGVANTRVNLFNPSAQTAHVTVEVVARSGSRQMTRTMPAGSVFSLRMRRTGEAPRGVVVTSDVAVVTTTSY